MFEKLALAKPARSDAGATAKKAPPVLAYADDGLICCSTQYGERSRYWEGRLRRDWQRRNLDCEGRVLVEKNKFKRPHSARTGEDNLDSCNSICSPEQIGNFATLHLFFYWMLFGQLILLLLCLFGYESLRPVIDWVASIIPSVESIRHSETIMNKELARAHHALMWLFPPVLVIATLSSPARQGEREFFLRTSSPFKTVLGRP